MANSSFTKGTLATPVPVASGGTGSTTQESARTALGLGTMATEPNTGSTSITTLGTIGTGTWNATAIGYTKGGTGLTTLGTGNQVLATNSGATAIEWQTRSSSISMNSGTTSRNLSDATGTQTIAHGLGVAPALVKMTALYWVSGAGSHLGGIAFGVYDGATDNCLYASAAYGSNPDSNFLFLPWGESGHYQRATISIDSTNITLSWTKVGSASGLWNIIWEAYV